MGFLSGITAGIYRTTRDGRRVFPYPVLPVRRRVAYVVSDADAPRLEHRLRRFFALSCFVVIPFLTLLFMNGPWWWWVPLAILGPHMVMRYWVLRDFPRITLMASDLEPLDSRARDLAQAEATGEPVLWLLLVAALLMAAGDVVVLLTDYVWWAWLGLLMFGTGAVLMARQIFMVRRARRRASPDAALTGVGLV